MGRGLGPLLAGTGQRAGQGTGPGGRRRAVCVPVIRGRAEGEEGDEAVVSGWIAVHVEAAAARRRMERRIDIGELDRVDGDAKVVVGAKNALYVNARG